MRGAFRGVCGVWGGDGWDPRHIMKYFSMRSVVLICCEVAIEWRQRRVPVQTLCSALRSRMQ